MTRYHYKILHSSIYRITSRFGQCVLQVLPSLLPVSSCSLLPHIIQPVPYPVSLLSSYRVPSQPAFTTVLTTALSHVHNAPSFKFSEYKMNLLTWHAILFPCTLAFLVKLVSGGSRMENCKT